LRVLLDTHIFLWALFEPSKLSATLTEIYQNKENKLFLSLVSVWEIQIKQQLGKLELQIDDLQQVITEQLQAGHIELLPISLEHIIALQSLPFHHNDPFDRLLIAQAIEENLSLASSDTKMPLYGAQVRLV
jgi:PIN domain nuclease of toxin-antitoxin system